MALNSDVASGVLQVGTFVRLPPWASTCPDPDSDVASCRVYSGAWRAGGRVRWHGREGTAWHSSSAAPPVQWGAVSSFHLSSPLLHDLPAVQQGDFVYGIASMFRVSVANLLAVNAGLSTDTVVQVSCGLCAQQGWV